jgi:hypothetical protein
MANIQDYARLPVFMDGNYLQQITSIDISWDGGLQRVDLLNEGLGGFTPGSGAVTINIGFAVPIGGTEADFVENLVDGAVVKMQVGIGRKAYIGSGKIQNAKISQSVNANVEGTCEWMGEFDKPK